MPKPNAKQQEAINSINGAVMLLAGPGTGKTFTLIERIKKMLAEGILPETILCLTFSDAASGEMKTRLIEQIGAKAGGVNVSTYHSFCMDIIRENPIEFEMTKHVQMADDVTKQAVLKEAIDEYGKIDFLKDKWGNKYFYISNILSGIETTKRERVLQDTYFDYLENVFGKELKELYLEKQEREEKGKLTKTCLNKIESMEKKIGKAKEFWSLYEIYRKKLAENSLIDYSDMINMVLEKLESDDDFLKNVAGGYKYILVDEYQDTSKVQNDLIFNILRGSKGNNIFVVGDDDQIIYSFQGARSRNLNDFLEKFPNTKIICLEENRRSTQNILDFSEILIEGDKFRLANLDGVTKKLIAKNDDVIKREQKIKLNIYSEFIQENNAIAESIENLIKSGEKPSEIAIISRRNDSLENFARLLKQKNIPFSLQKQKNAFEIPSFIQTFFYLKILANSYIEQDKIFGLLSFEPFKIEDEALAKILKNTRCNSKNWVEAIQELPELEDFYKTYTELKIKKSYTPLVPYIYEVITKTGILEYYSNLKTPECFENIQAIERLINEAKSFSLLHKGAFLDDFIKHLNTYFNEDIKLELKKSANKENAVQLVTFHGSKGREFNHVFIPNLTAKAFEKASTGRGELDLPIQKSKFSDDKEENKDAELLRLLFVGFTRARFGLYLSYANSTDGVSQTASKYISNLFPKADFLVEQKIHEIDNSIFLNETIKSLEQKPNSKSYTEELKTRIGELVISQTSLNKYMNCPLQYFYSDILNVPVFVEDKDVLSYGLAIHHSIEFMTNKAIEKGFWVSVDLMYEKFLEKMETVEFTTPQKYEEYKERGKNSIFQNYPKFVETNPKNILSAEYKMELKFEGCTLKGFADRISKDSEGKIHIFDFKTGSYKKVKPNEKYYNQLRFYKFLYEELNPKSKIGNCALVFFEEGCKTSSPEADMTDNLEIKEKISDCIKNINALNFEPKPNKENCKLCAYGLICKMQHTKI